MNNVRVVLDTNLLLSASLFKTSLARKAFDAVVTSESEIILSKAVLEELTDVFNLLRFDRYVSVERRNQFLADFLELVEMVEITKTIVDCRDPKDNKFLKLAISGYANYILTNDKDLFVLNPYENITIATPIDFIATIH
ncbi:MAG: putative toxin-antitoxin system toxin component, PIN family [Alkalinema sp. CAN_BIN05]|nr:putative toxin-antitoxin system toxin component, PIN family [Alkalinema sp. CAN_BIN05]